MILRKTKQGKHDRTLGYLCKLYSSLKVGEVFSRSSPITLINFDSFGTFDNELADYAMVNYEDTQDFYSKN